VPAGGSTVFDCNGAGIGVVAAGAVHSLGGIPPMARRGDTGICIGKPALEGVGGCKLLP